MMACMCMCYDPPVTALQLDKCREGHDWPAFAAGRRVGRGCAWTEIRAGERNEVFR